MRRELGDHDSVAIGLINQAMVSIARGDAREARNMLREVLDLVRETGSKYAGQSALDVIAALCSVCADWRAAARFYGAAEAQLQATGLNRYRADEAFLQPLVSRIRGAIDSASFREHESAGRALSYDGALEEARRWLMAQAHAPGAQLSSA